MPKQLVGDAPHKQGPNVGMIGGGCFLPVPRNACAQLALHVSRPPPGLVARILGGGFQLLIGSTSPDSSAAAQTVVSLIPSRSQKNHHLKYSTSRFATNYFIGNTFVWLCLYKKHCDKHLGGISPKRPIRNQQPIHSLTSLGTQATSLLQPKNAQHTTTTGPKAPIFLQHTFYDVSAPDSTKEKTSPRIVYPILHIHLLKPRGKKLSQKKDKLF